MNAFKLIAVVLLLAVALLGFEAWSRLAPAIQDGTIGAGIAVRVLLPVVALAAVAIWFWRQR